MSIPMVSLLPGKIYLEPDVVGLKEPADIVAIEVKSDRRGILDGLGKCLAYTAAADKVYLALNENLRQEIRTPSLFEHLKIGLLNIRFGKRIDDELHNRLSNLEKEIGANPIIGEGAITDVKKFDELLLFQRQVEDEQTRPEGWFVEEVLKPQLNYNVDFAGLHTELLRQTKAALGRS